MYSKSGLMKLSFELQDSINLQFTLTTTASQNVVMFCIFVLDKQI